MAKKDQGKAQEPANDADSTTDSDGTAVDRADDHPSPPASAASGAETEAAGQDDATGPPAAERAEAPSQPPRSSGDEPKTPPASKAKRSKPAPPSGPKAKRAQTRPTAAGKGRKPKRKPIKPKWNPLAGRSEPKSAVELDKKKADKKKASPKTPKTKTADTKATSAPGVTPAKPAGRKPIEPKWDPRASRSDTKSAVKPDKKRAARPFGDAKPEQPKKRAPRPTGSSSQSAHEAKMRSLREALVRASREHWTEYLAALNERLDEPDGEDVPVDTPPSRGDWVKLDRVDYTRQFNVRGVQVVFHDDEHRQPWAILIDKRFSALIDVSSDVELGFRFERLTEWDIVGRVAGFDFVHDDFLRSRKVPTVRVNALHRPGQFVVFHHPKQGPRVPALSDAREQLDAIHEQLTIPRVDEPRGLIGTLLSIIATGNLRRFNELSVTPPDPHLLRRRFVQFVKAYNACQGQVAFDRYDDEWSLQSPGPSGEVKMFVERVNTDGDGLVRPLTFVKDEGRWKLKAGIF